MHIVQVAESLEVGGAERVVVELSNALAARHEVTVVCMQKEGELAAQLDGRIRLHCLGKRPAEGSEGARRLAHLLRTLRPQALHNHHWGTYLDCASAGWRARVPVMIHTAHGLYMPCSAGFWSGAKRAARHWLERRSMNYCRRVVCVSEPLVAHVVEEVGISARQIEVIPNGVRTEHLDSGRALARPADGRFVCVSVGRLSAVKNFGLLLEAFARARSECPQLVLRIVGDGPERQSLQAFAAARGITEQVEFLGLRTDVDAILHGADLFVLASLSEGMPMAVLEAMRAGLPVLATRVGGLPSIVTEGITGCLVASGDAPAMAAALTSFARAPQKARAMGAAGSERVQRDFSIQAMSDRYERLFGATR